MHGHRIMVQLRHSCFLVWSLRELHGYDESYDTMARSTSLRCGGRDAALSPGQGGRDPSPPQESQNQGGCLCVACRKEK